MINVTTTATLRPDILDRTLNSFFANMFVDRDVRLILNIDPVGDSAYTPGDVLEVATKYFGHAVNAHVADDGNFSAACIRVWSAVESEYFINLEDDWELIRPVSLDDMVRLMDAHSNLAILRLPFTDSETTRAKQWNLWYPWNGVFFQCPRELKGTAGFCNHPSLIRKEFMHRITPNMDPYLCPEKQIKGHSPVMRRILEQYEYGVFQIPQSEKAVVDIGRQWLYEHKLRKNKKGGYHFTTWEAA